MNCAPNVFAFAAECASKMGGLESILIANPDAVRVTLNVGAGTATLAAVTAGAKPFYRWELAPNASTLESTAQISEANNTRFFQHVLTAVLNNFSPTTAGANLLQRLTRLCVVVQTRSGRSLLVSVANGTTSRGMEVSGFVLSQGAQRSDAAGRATLTAQLDSPYLPLEVSNVANLVND